MAKIVPYETEGKQTVLQEYEILKGLHHKHIMTLHEAYITPRYLVLIAELCTGKEILYHFVDRFAAGRGDGEGLGLRKEALEWGRHGMMAMMHGEGTAGEAELSHQSSLKSASPAVI